MSDNSTDSQPMEVIPPSTVFAIEKAMIDQQIATAHMYPRSLELFKKRALSMATLDPETAESCIYVRPVGKELNKATGRWEEKYAEGPSIRLAEIVAVSFGNLRAAARVVEQTDRYVKCQGMAHDLESNTAMSADCIESTVTKEGHPYSERQRALTAKVCAAKALRDAILKVVPRALCKPVLEAAKKVASGAEQPLELRRKKAQAWVGALKIDENRVFAALNVQGWTEITNEHLLILTGLKTAIQEGDETIDSAFPAIAKAAEVDPPAGRGRKPKETKAEPPKTPQDAPGTPEGVQTPPKPETPQGGAAAAATPPQDKPPGEEKTVAEPPKEQTPTPAPEQQTQPPAEPDAYFAPKQGDTDGIASVKLLAAKSGVTWFQLQGWLRKTKLMKAEQQHLSELASSKIDALCRNWGAKLPEIRSMPVK